ncbi:MAG: glycoside hydrolase family 15 protein [Solirubrobacterales bacterium]
MVGEQAPRVAGGGRDRRTRRRRRVAGGPSRTVTRPATFPHALRDYALLADGERGVLVGPRGDFVWMCFPRWHDDAVFSSLVGGASSYTVAPRGRFVWGGYYEPDTLIWRSRWITEEGIVECREALALPARVDRAIVLRRLVAVEGPARVGVALAAGAGFDRHGMARLHQGEDGAWTAELGEERMRWVGAEEAQPTEGGARERALALEVELEPGEERDFVLVLQHGEAASPPHPPQRLWDATEQAWKERVPAIDDCLATRDARHAYVVMSGLTSSSGAMVAAATTSLPERAEQGRNYDYRFAWIRDQAYAGQAVAAAGPHPLLDDAVRFTVARLLEDGPDLMPAYTVEGRPVPAEKRLDLPGYPGGDDVVGNRVRDQFQLDVFGEILMLLSAAAPHDRLDADGWRAVEVAAEAIGRRWGEPDAGIWEIEPALWTHSRLICAAGLKAIAAHSPGREQAASWLALADRLLAEAARTCVAPGGRWQRAAEDSRLDASLLLGAIRGAVPADDPRSLATLEAVAAELTEDGYCFRFQPQGLPLGQAEGAFLLCGFWLALAYAQQGDMPRAMSWFERNRAACGTPGLFSEEFDVRQRQLRGNLPQAFVHALMLECAAKLAR